MAPDNSLDRLVVRCPRFGPVVGLIVLFGLPLSFLIPGLVTSHLLERYFLVQKYGQAAIADGLHVVGKGGQLSNGDQMETGPDTICMVVGFAASFAGVASYAAVLIWSDVLPAPGRRRTTRTDA